MATSSASLLGDEVAVQPVFIDSPVRPSSKLKQLISFNRRIARKKNRFGQILSPILSNVLVIAMIRSVNPDVTFPASRPLTVYDPIAGCVASEGKVALIYCNDLEAPGGTLTCREVYSSIESTMAMTGVATQLYTDLMDFREQFLLLGNETLGVEIAYSLDKWEFQFDLPGSLYTFLSREAEGSGMTCRVHGDPSCAPQQFVYSCASALEVAVLRAVHEDGDISVGFSKYQIFPQKSLVVNGITSSYLVWLIPMYLSGLFLNIYNFALIELVIEREGHLVEYLLAWGFTRAVHFQAWLAWNGSMGFLVAFLTSLGLVKLGVFPTASFFSLFAGSLMYFVSLLSLAYGLSIKLASSRTASSVASFSELIFSVTAISVGAAQNLALSIIFGLIPTVPFYLLIRAVAYEDSPLVVNPGLSVAGCLGLGLGVTLALVVCTIWVASSRAPRSHGRVDTQDHQMEGGLGIVSSLSSSVPVVDIQHLVKQYPGSDTPALSGVDLVIGNQGQVVTVMGGNGAGKSTLIKTLLRCETVSAAQKFCVPENACIGVCFQEDTFWDVLSVGEHLDFFAGQVCGIPDARIQALAQQFGLADVMSNPASTLSGGQKRRLSSLLAFAKAELPSTQLLILDEPTTGIDVAGRRLIWDQIRRLKSERRVSVLLTTHYLDEAEELSDQVVFLAEGKVKQQGSVIDLRKGYVVGVEAGLEHVISAEIKAKFPTVDLEVTGPGLIRISSADHPSVLGAILHLEQMQQTKRIAYFSFESVSLENLFTRETSDGTPTLEPRYLGTQKKLLPQILGLASIRVKSVVHNFGSFFATVLFPIVFLVASVALRKMFFGTADIPADFGEQEIHLWRFADGFNVTSGLVPVVGFVNPESVPFPLLPVPAGVTMMDFLFSSDEFYPFALDAVHRTVWLNPSQPRSGFVLTGIAGGVDVPDLSIATAMDEESYTALVMGGVDNLGWFLTVSLVSMSIQIAALLFDEKLTLIRKLMEVQGLHPLAYWLGSGLGHLALNYFVVGVAYPVVAEWMLGGVVAGIPGGWPLLLIAAAVSAVQVVLAGYVLVYLFASKELMLKNVSFYGFFGVPILMLVGFACMTGWTWVILSLVNPFATFPDVLMLLVRLDLASCSIITRECEWTHASLWTQSLPVVLGLFQIGFMLGLVLLVEEGNRHAGKIADSTWVVQGPTTACHPSVSSERARILNSCSDKILLIKLWHAFPKTCRGWTQLIGKEDAEENPVNPPIKWVLRDLTFGVPQNEVVGLLGENGAGKSTAISALLRSIVPIGGYAGISSGTTVGFCPQTHALWPKVSGLDHVAFYQKVRGLLPQDARKILARVGIPEDHHQMQVRKYSGGMKRRLQIAIALIGEPEVLILDEPTAGVDVAGKREIWNIIKSVCVGHNFSVLLTTHSLEEADNLSSRICIMDQGRLVRVGTTAELKQEHNRMYVTLETLPGFVSSGFIHTLGRNHVKSLVEGDVRKFQVELRGLKLSTVYQTLIELEQARRISKFTLSHPSLEDVFLETIGKPVSIGLNH